MLLFCSFKNCISKISFSLYLGVDFTDKSILYVTWPMKKYICFLHVEYYVTLFVIANNTSFLYSELETPEGKLSKILS